MSHSAKSFSTAGNEDLIRTTLVGAGLPCNLQTRRCSNQRFGVQNLQIKWHEKSVPVWPQSEQTLFFFSRYWGGATYSSSNTEESAAFRFFRLKLGWRRRLKRPRRSHGQFLWWKEGEGFFSITHL